MAVTIGKAISRLKMLPVVRVTNSREDNQTKGIT